MVLLRNPDSKLDSASCPRGPNIVAKIDGPPSAALAVDGRRTLIATLSDGFPSEVETVRLKSETPQHMPETSTLLGRNEDEIIHWKQFATLRGPRMKPAVANPALTQQKGADSCSPQSPK